MKCFVRQRVATWVDNFYEVEIPDEDIDPEADPSEQLQEAFYSGDYKYLGHTESDNVDFLDTEEEFTEKLTGVIVNPAGD